MSSYAKLLRDLPGSLLKTGTVVAIYGPVDDEEWALQKQAGAMVTVTRKQEELRVVGLAGENPLFARLYVYPAEYLQPCNRDGSAVSPSTASEPNGESNV